MFFEYRSTGGLPELSHDAPGSALALSMLLATFCNDRHNFLIGPGSQTTVASALAPGFPSPRSSTAFHALTRAACGAVASLAIATRPLMASTE